MQDSLGLPPLPGLSQFPYLSSAKTARSIPYIMEEIRGKPTDTEIKSDGDIYLNITSVNAGSNDPFKLKHHYRVYLLLQFFRNCLA